MMLLYDRYGRVITSRDDKINTIYTVTDPQNQGGNVAFTLGFPIGTPDERILSTIEAMVPNWYTFSSAPIQQTKAQLLKQLADLTAKINNL